MIYDTNTQGGQETQGKMNSDEYIRKTLKAKKERF